MHMLPNKIVVIKTNTPDTVTFGLRLSVDKI